MVKNGKNGKKSNQWRNPYHIGKIDIIDWGKAMNTEIILKGINNVQNQSLE